MEEKKEETFFKILREYFHDKKDSELINPQEDKYSNRLIPMCPDWLYVPGIRKEIINKTLARILRETNPNDVSTYLDKKLSQYKASHYDMGGIELDEGLSQLKEKLEEELENHVGGLSLAITQYGTLKMNIKDLNGYPSVSIYEGEKKYGENSLSEEKFYEEILRTLKQEAVAKVPHRCTD